MKKIKVGVLGCANIAIRSLIPEFFRHEDFELYAIASRDIEKAREIAKQYNVRFCNYESLVEDSQIDLIYIPLPTGLHNQWVVKSLKSNKHVLCEKSLGTSLNEVEQMINIARGREKALVENFQFQYHSQQTYIKEIIASGEIGEIRCFKSSFGFPPFPDKNNIRYNKSLGGGALLDAGAYTIKATQFFLGDHFKVSAASLVQSENYEVDIYGAGFLKNNKGMTSEIAFGFDNYYQCNIEIWGSKGRLITNRTFTAQPDFIPEVLIETNKGTEKRKMPADNHFKKMLDHVSQAILTRNFEEDYIMNYNQADLMQQFTDINNGK